MLNRDPPDPPSKKPAPQALVLCSPHVDVGPSCAQWLKLQQLQARVAELEHSASTDALTGLATRTALEQAGRRELFRQSRYGHPCSLVFCDIDHFKTINDTHGHAVGDAVLQALAASLADAARDLDLVARYGGEEFVLLLPNTGMQGAFRAAERVRKRIAFHAVEPVGGVTASFGVAQAELGEAWEAWVRRADTAMYEAKRSGRNRVAVAPMQEPALVKDAATPNFMQLVWRESYASGNAHIDQHHQRLFAVANDVLASAFDGSRRKLLPLLETLIADCRTHFHDEELILAAAGYPDVRAHAAHHQRLLASALAQYDQYAQGAGDVGALVTFLAKDVIALHILQEDRAYFAHVQGAPT